MEQMFVQKIAYQCIKLPNNQREMNNSTDTSGIRQAVPTT